MCINDPWDMTKTFARHRSTLEVFRFLGADRQVTSRVYTHLYSLDDLHSYPFTPMHLHEAPLHAQCSNAYNVPLYAQRPFLFLQLIVDAWLPCPVLHGFDHSICMNMKNMEPCVTYNCHATIYMSARPYVPLSVPLLFVTPATCPSSNTISNGCRSPEKGLRTLTKSERKRRKGSKRVHGKSASLTTKRPIRRQCSTRHCRTTIWGRCDTRGLPFTSISSSRKCAN